MKYAVGSMFAGVGGICLSFLEAKYKDNEYNIIWANEIDKYASKTYSNNFKHKLYNEDINNIIYDDHYLDIKNDMFNSPIDVLVAGFPCQAFSIAGQQMGLQDKDRGQLFLSIIRVVNILKEKFHKPRVIFLENVKNLQSHDKGNTYKVIKKTLKKEGYYIKDCILNTKDFTNLPQNRERIFIVCFLNKNDYNNFTFFDHIDTIKKNHNKDTIIGNIRQIIDIDQKVDPKYYYTKEKYPNYFLTEEQYLQIPLEKRKKRRINLSEEITEFYEFYQVRRGMYVRKNQNGVCPTLTANMGTGGHNVPLIKTKYGIRKLTPEETFKLQGFPISNGYILPTNLSNGHLYKQAGNAVSVNLVKLIAKNILKTLSL